MPKVEISLPKDPLEAFLSGCAQGQWTELTKVIKDLENCKVHSPFNEFYLRDFIVDKYKTRLKTLTPYDNTTAFNA